MKLSHTLLAWSIATLLTAAAPQVLAGDGHDHGEAPSPAAGPALPRFSAVSELFELVGVVDGKAVTLYLDHFADNRPVEEARLELELGGQPISVALHAPGEFEATLAAPLQPGVVSVTATVFAGEEVDLLAGELDLHEESEAHAEPQASGWRWQDNAPWLGAAALVVGLLGWGVMRKGRAGNGRPGGAA